MRSNSAWRALAFVVVPAALAAQDPPPTPPVVTPTQATQAQAAAQAATGRTVSNADISAAIQNSGLTQAQIQARLRSAGYDPALADPFFGAAAGGAGGAGGAAGGAGGAAGGNAAEFAQALQRLGILSTPTDDAQVEETTRPSADRPSGRAGGVFGKDIFARATTVFDPVTSGPVDPAYRLGIGDQIQLVVTGQVELAYALELRRDGTVIVPQVGQISLAGLTMDAARTVLRTRMGRSYSGLNNGEARLDLSISGIRSNAVFVIGEVEAPGAYQVNALATVFHAIARAGGPTDRGSFRNIEVRRGNRVVQRLDLYDYLLRGDASGDVRLEQGDQIYVPLNTRVVAITGQVRRPRIFELRENEGFSDLLNFAGGLLASASVERVQIDRILPPERRAPGFERVKVDVDIKGQMDSLARVRLLDADIVQVFGIGDVRRNVVQVGGQVFQPGEFELRPGMTLGALITEAQGMLPWALADRVKVIRQLPLTGQTILHNVDATSPAGQGFLLEEFDSIEILDSRVAYPGGQFTVSGAVIAPRVFPYAQSVTLRDAIERAGGVREAAQRIEVYRRKVGAAYNDTTTIRFSFPVGQDFTRGNTLRDFVLERDDRVEVMSSPGFRSQKFVTVGGDFAYPGAYAITENTDRISDIVSRAGGTLPGAYPATFALVRGGRTVAIDFTGAMGGDRSQDVPLLAGDQLVISRDPRTVLVTGAVISPSLIRYQSGRSLRDYIELAGGPADNANLNKSTVQDPAGITRRVRRVALFFHASPDVISGSTITVPVKPESKTTAAEVWQRILTSTSALASIAIAYAAITR